MSNSSLPVTLNEKSLLEGISYLAGKDTYLAQIVNDFGNPPMWDRNPGFPTLLHIILEQQVSLASAKAAFTKLETASGEITPKRFLAFSDEDFREFGFSRQKTRYGRELSRAILNGQLNIAALGELDDQSVRRELIKVKGVGEWTANIYLLMTLLRPDIWPTGDLAIAKAVQAVYNLSKRPTQDELKLIAEQWKPWRAVAARILWHYYLSA